MMGKVYTCACYGGDLDGEVYDYIPICENCSIDFDDLSAIGMAAR